MTHRNFRDEVEMIKGKHYEITAKNFLSHEWIGLEVKVVKSTDSSRIGLVGIVLDETKNTLKIETKSGLKIVPKIECEFEFKIGEEKVIVKGNEIVKRSEDRVKDF